MSKYIKKLTKKQRESMTAYRDHWIEQGLKTGETDWKTFDKYMPICYEKTGLQYPKNVIRVNSPLVGGLASAIAEAILRKKHGAVGGAVGGAIGVAIDGVVREAVDEAVDGAVGEAIGGVVGEAVREAVGGAIGVAIGGVVREAVDEAIDGVVREAVGGAIGGVVREAVDEAVGGAVDGAIGGVVREAVDGAIGEAVDEAIGAKVILSWHYWLGGQFWVGGWYLGVAFVNFFFDICKLKLSKDIMERAHAYRKVCESVNYIWPNKDFVMVCARPTKIERNAEGRLHSLSGKAIEYPDGWGLYYVHGAKFTEEQYEKAKKADFKELLSWPDIEQRSALLRDKSLEKMLKEANAKIVDQTDREGGYILWEVDLGLGEKTKAMTYNAWSGNKKYAKWVPNTAVNCLETIASLRGITVDEFTQATKS